MKYDWYSSKTEILFNPRLPDNEKALFESKLPQVKKFQDHFWVSTSGTSGRVKFAALSKDAILVSASSVNKHLDSHSSDVWLHVLPDFHVGGLGIWARASLSGAKVIDLKDKMNKWDPHLFAEALIGSKATLTALVPTQIYDLVSSGYKAPKYLRGVIVGGGGLSKALFAQAYDMGWRLMPSYGLTECASQVATAEVGADHGSAKVLSHVEVKIDLEGFIVLKSKALLTAYGLVVNGGVKIVDPKEDGWFKTEDKGELRSGKLTVLGRSSDFVKVGGESCSLVHLRTIFDEVKREQDINGDMVIAASPDERLGHVIHLFVEDKSYDRHLLKGLVDRFNAQILPFERIRAVHSVKEIPRSPIGKVLWGDLGV